MQYILRAWRWLTSMRTALILLFLLALGAIPGALLPQRSLNETKVLEYLANNGKTAEIYDKLQLFDVFSSLVHRHLRSAIHIPDRLHPAALVGALPRHENPTRACPASPG